MACFSRHAPVSAPFDKPLEMLQLAPHLPRDDAPHIASLFHAPFRPLFHLQHHAARALTQIVEGRSPDNSYVPLIQEAHRSRLRILGLRGRLSTIAAMPAAIRSSSSNDIPTTGFRSSSFADPFG
jgi:hypothetical protein